ncbi:hypothetical protein K445DRAFT_12802 [Daldinia sp. EC12]|nr:hypothetical protein K445DRAFT_12802 [Daldinia sp. EC12]
MCRRIFTHNMHHDVRPLMITSLAHENQRVYANPLRTPFHRCGISIPIPGHWLLNNPHQACTYHSCCQVSDEVEYCSVFTEDLLETSSSEDEMEPEQCPRFVWQHRHKRLEYLGQPGSYDVEYPATWRDDVEEIEDVSWFRYFRREPELLLNFATRLFKSCEEYYQLEQDAGTNFLVYRDLATSLPRGDPRVSIAEDQLTSIQTRLTWMKQDLHSRAVWAQRLDPEQTSRNFIPIWWLRMWSVKQGIEEAESNHSSSSDYST